MKKLVLCLLCAALIFTAACSAVPEAQESGGLTAPPPQTSADPSAETSAAPSAETSNTPAPSAQQYLITTTIKSKLLEDNLINASPERTLVIYLPPSYYESDKAYPVVYYLHGHGEPAGVYIKQNKSRLDDAFKTAKEFIFVGVDGGSSYYVNSPVSGAWEDYILQEVIPMIDGTYRTIADASSRGICGMSMGGFGSINLALRHPDVFCSVYAMSPGLLKDDGFSEAMKSWKSDRAFLTDYSRAFAPNADAELLGDVPKLDGSNEDKAVIKKWMSGFGDLKGKLDAYIALGKPLKAIGFSYGTEDAYTWIPKGTQYFSELLKEKGIENSIFTFNGGHTQPPNGIAELIVPFFNENLEY